MDQKIMIIAVAVVAIALVAVLLMMQTPSTTSPPSVEKPPPTVEKPEIDKEANECEVDSDCEYAWFTGGCNTPEYVAKVMSACQDGSGPCPSEAPPREGVTCTCEDNKCVTHEPEPATGQTEDMTVTVGPNKVDCTGVGPMECLIVDGEAFYDPIEGFDYEEGYEYVIMIRRTQVYTPETAPADASLYEYGLIYILYKFGATEPAPGANPTTDRTACEALGGTWLGGTCQPPSVSAYGPPLDPDLLERCELAGGTWTQFQAEGGTTTCELPFPDAGKQCTSSDECVGSCTVTKIADLGGSGTCQATTLLTLCETPIEADYIECLYDDIMAICEEGTTDPMCDPAL